MLNKELFTYDPTQREIPNTGVAKIGRPSDDKGWATLKFELEHFVCEGQYEAGLERVLSGFLAHMDRPEQPAVWVSGFYGSGKSHFLKVLDALWTDVKAPEGWSARGIVGLSERVSQQLIELDTLGRREGGVWSAAGSLSASAAASPRLGFLDILLGSAGLPQRYDAARLVLWMKREGMEKEIRDALSSKGRTLEQELDDMYVSQHLGEALHAVMPALAPSAAGVLKRLSDEYLLRDKDITDGQLVDVTERILNLVAAEAGKPGRAPVTLIVIDELQQYIGEDVGRTLIVQQIVETLSSRFGSRILFVAAGQSAMGVGTTLQKLQGRFTGRVEFTDTDVDRVVRQVILCKAPDKVALLDERLTDVSGEINRHLQGTKLRPVPEDARTMTQDYPLLPTRRRFWENVLRAIDRGGSSGQLRTQLRSVQEATKYVAELPVGVVVPGDFIYEQQVTGMLHSGVLPKDTHEMIERLKDGSIDGGLKHRAAALIFLIGQLKESNKDLGVRADASTLADLLVADLNDGSSMLRTDVEGALSALVDAGVLQAIDGEYLLQSKVGAEWQQDYLQRVNRIRDEAARIAAVRAEHLQQTLARHVGNLGITQGEARAPRKGQFFYGADVPDLSGGSIPVWVRDEWTVGSLKAAEDEAAARGSEDPVVHVLIRKQDPQAIKDEIVKMLAAEDTLNAKDHTTTEEGQVARAGIQGRRMAAEAQLARLMGSLLSDARVLVSGGNEMREADLRASVEAGLRAAAQRMFPKFNMADGNWGLVVKRASEGAGATALEVLGYQGAPDKHPVCAEFMKYLGSASKRGSEIRDHFMGRPYGWPKDAVDGAVMVLARTEQLKVLLNGAPALASQVTQDKLGKFTFALEHGPILSADQRMKLRKLFAECQINYPAGSESEALASFLTQLATRGESAGGQPPRPPAPSPSLVREIEALSGNARLVSAFENLDALRDAWIRWSAAESEIPRRMSEWNKLQVLLARGELLPEVSGIREQAGAVESSRALLADPDPVRPLVHQASDAIRSAILARLGEYKRAREEGVVELQSEAAFEQLPPETWRPIIEKNGLGPLPDIELGSHEQLIAELDRHPLGMWQDLIAGMRGRIAAARNDLAKAVAPATTTYAPPARRLTTPAEVDTYVQEVRAALMDAIKDGNPVIIQR